MNEQWRNSGAKISIFTKNNEVIAGWLVYQDPLKLIVAMDVKRENLRTILTRDILELVIDSNDENRIAPAIDFERLRRMNDFEPVLNRNVAPAVENVNYRLLLRNAHRLREMLVQAQRSGTNRPDGQAPAPLISPRQAYESLDLSLELLAEMQRTGLLSVIYEYPEELRQIVHEETIPAFDAAWVGVESSHQMVSLAQDRKEDLQETTDAIVEAREKVWTRKDTARWIDGGGDVVLGATMATANVAAGVAAGILGLLPTLGIGTVGAVLGAATSAVTGLITLKKGAATLIKGEA
jgi:hypothetical protein